MIGDFRIADILGLVVILLAMGYIIANRRFLSNGLKNPFFLAFLVLSGEILAANLERAFLPAFFNLIEHTLRAGFSVLLAIACWNLGMSGEEEGR